MAVLKATGTVVWLDVPMHVLLPRLERSGGDRPLLFGLRGEQLEARVAGLMQERQDCYAQAHAIVQADAPPDEVARRVMVALSALQPR
jgi:shikimate kinase